MNPYIEAVYKQQLTDTHDQHTGVLEAFRSIGNDLHKDVTIKLESEVEDSDVEGKDVVVAVGGDHTFLKASGLIQDDMPIVGVNSYAAAFHGALCTNAVTFTKRK